MHSRKGESPNHMRPMKVAFVTHSISHFEVPFIRQLASSHEVEMTVFYSEEIGIKEAFDPLYNRAIKWGIPILEGYTSQFIRRPVEIVSALSMGKFDAAIIYGFSDSMRSIAILTCLICGIPIIFRGTATLLEQRGFAKRIVKRTLMTSLYKKFSAVLVGGTYNKAYFEHYGVRPDRMFWVPFTVDVDRYKKLSLQNNSEKETIRRSLGINTLCAILFVGTLIPKKGPQVLLPAFKILSEQEQNVCLLIAGDGVLMNELREYAQIHGIDDRVKFLGFMDQNELPKVYAAADLVVFPSLFDETWARAVNEAMSCGLPIIASKKVGATGDIIKNGVNGFVIKDNDPIDLAEKMRILTNDQALRLKMGEASREIISGWTYEAAIPNALESIRHACAQRSRTSE